MRHAQMFTRVRARLSVDGICDSICLKSTEARWVTGSLAWMYRVLGGSTVSIASQQNPIPLRSPLPPPILLSFPPSFFSNCCIGDLSPHAETNVWSHGIPKTRWAFVPYAWSFNICVLTHFEWIIEQIPDPFVSLDRSSVLKTARPKFAPRWRTFSPRSAECACVCVCYSEHLYNYLKRCWRWTQTPGCQICSSQRGASAPCSTFSWTGKDRRRDLLVQNP